MAEILPVSPDVIHSELEAAQAIISKWREAVSQGIPGVDTPAGDEAFTRFLTEMCGELLLVSAKCQALASVVGEGYGG